jgi:hypothetical protein
MPVLSAVIGVIGALGGVIVGAALSARRGIPTVAVGPTQVVVLITLTLPHEHAFV